MTDDNRPPQPKQPTPPSGRTFTFKRSFTFGRPPPQADDPNATIIEGPTRRFEWTLGPPTDQAAGDDGGLGRPPETYYEALSGRPDPHREFLVTARRTLNLIVTLTAVAIPVGLVALTIVTGQTLETIVFAGIAGAIVGLMLKTTFPRTPFG